MLPTENRIVISKHKRGNYTDIRRIRNIPTLRVRFREYPWAIGDVGDG